MSKFKEAIFLNGKFILKDEAKIPVLEPGFLYGWGLFETMRAYSEKIVYLNEHLIRMKDSCRLIHLRFPYPFDKLKRIIEKTVRISRFRDAYIRLTLWKSEHATGTLIIVREYNPYPKQKYKSGFRAKISSFRQNDSSLLARMKTTSRLLYELSFNEAKFKGFDEAIILNNRGYITEASRSNIFLVRDSALFTPDLECGCLGGITRRVIFALAKKYNIKIYEGNFTAQDLYNADEAFLTNSLMGVMPLAAVEKHKIGKGLAGRITEYFVKKYNLLLERRSRGNGYK